MKKPHKNISEIPFLTKNEITNNVKTICEISKKAFFSVRTDLRRKEKGWERERENGLIVKSVR